MLRLRHIVVISTTDMPRKWSKIACLLKCDIIKQDKQNRCFFKSWNISDVWARVENVFLPSPSIAYLSIQFVVCKYWWGFLFVSYIKKTSWEILLYALNVRHRLLCLKIKCFQVIQTSIVDLAFRSPRQSYQRANFSNTLRNYFWNHLAISFSRVRSRYWFQYRVSWFCKIKWL